LWNCCDVNELTLDYIAVDVSLYKEESQLKKRKAPKRKASSALRAAKKVSTTTKSPDQPKVRKVAVKTARKNTKRVASAAPRAKKPATVETKKPTTSTSRTDRAKRRSDNQNHNKVSPVVDQKKARVLAKVARKGAVNTTSKGGQSAAKNAKVPKATPSSSKVQKSAPKAAVKKTKRSSRK
jgi:hypothetical protein